VRVINEANEQLGIFDNREALRMAREAGMDLVEVAPNERPPVCRIMDYGKFKYHQKKNVRKHHEQQLKELRIRPKTDDHDREIKINQALRFLKAGDKVQFKMVFRGRERAHREIGIAIFRGIIAHFGDLTKIERPPTMDGRDMVMILGPNKAALDKLAADEKPPPGKPGSAPDGPVRDMHADARGRATTPKPPPAEPAPRQPQADTPPESAPPSPPAHIVARTPSGASPTL
jgi:translation initiation factor IF-3